MSALNSSQHFRLLVGVRLIDRKLRGKRRLLQWVGFRAGLFRRDIDRDDIFAALDERFEHSLAERLLSVNHNTHRKNLSSDTERCLPLAGVKKNYAASALAGLSGAVIAPDILISATSFSE